MLKKDFDGKNFWYVMERFYEEKDANGDEVCHKMFYTMPYEFHPGDADGYNYNPERMFETESEANQMAFELTDKFGY